MHAGSSADRRFATRRRRRRRGADGLMSEINVTPFVDVMLVLLIVFMIAAPLLSIGVPVELPRSDESAPLPADQQILTISVTREGRIFLQDNEVGLDELQVRLRALRRGPAEADEAPAGEEGEDGGDSGEVAQVAQDAQDGGAAAAGAAAFSSGSIYVRGDSQAQYGLMARIIAIVKAAGFRRIGFITENNPEP